MMMRLMIALLWVGALGQAMAAELGTAAPGAVSAVPATEAVSAVPAATAPATEAASAVPAAIPAAPATTDQPHPPEAPVPQAEAPVSKSAIPLEKRKGGDITQCLEAGSKSDKDIAACAEKYRP